MAVNGWLSPLLPAGFYYKTFKWPARVLDPGLRAPDPARGRPRRGAAGARSRPLRQAPCPLRRAGGRRRPGRARRSARRRPQRRAGGAGRRADALRRAAAGGAAARSRARRRWPGSSRRWPSSRACPRSRCCRAPRRSATTTTIWSRWSRRCAEARAPASAAPAPVDGAGAGGGAGDRRDRAAAGVRRQRPAGRDAGGRGAHLPQPLRRGARQPARSCSRPATTPIAPRSISRRPASRSPRWSTRASTPDAPLAAGGARRRHRDR